MKAEQGFAARWRQEEFRRFELASRSGGNAVDAIGSPHQPSRIRFPGRGHDPIPVPIHSRESGGIKPNVCERSETVCARCRDKVPPRGPERAAIDAYCADTLIVKTAALTRREGLECPTVEADETVSVRHPYIAVFGFPNPRDRLFRETV